MEGAQPKSPVMPSIISKLGVDAGSMRGRIRRKFEKMNVADGRLLVSGVASMNRRPAKKRL
jgi:hypothetical protein